MDATINQGGQTGQPGGGSPDFSPTSQMGAAGRGSNQSGSGGAADFISMLSPEMQSHPAAAKFKGKSADEFLKSYSNLESLIGKKTIEKEVIPEGLMKIPTMDSPAEDIDAFLQALGVPDDPTAYQAPDFSDMEDRLPPGFTPDEKIDAWFRQKAHNLALTPGQFQGLYKEFIDFQLQHQQEYVASFEEQTKQAYGKDFEKVVRIAERAARRLSPETQEMVGRFIGRDPVLTRVLHELGQNLGESQAPDGAVPYGTTNRISDLRKRHDEIMADPQLQKEWGSNRPLFKELQSIQKTLMGLGELK